MELWIRTTIFNLVFFVYMVYVHELGHVLAYYKIEKRLPKLHFNWFSIQIRDMGKMSINQTALVAITGILTGELALIIPMIVMPQNSLVYAFAYFLLSRRICFCCI